MISKKQNFPPLYLTLSNITYNLQQLKTNLIDLRRQNLDFLTTNFGQEAPQITLMNKSIKMFGKSKKNQGEGSLYSISLVTGLFKQWIVVEQQGLEKSVPGPKSKYGILEFQGQICIFGGVKKSIIDEKSSIKYFDELYKFCPYTNTWTLLAGRQLANEKPQPRIPFIFQVIKGSSIFLYGGYNDQNNFNDAYIFTQGTWVQLKIKTKQISDKLHKIKGIAKCVHNGNIFLHGGYDVDKKQALSQIYKLEIDLSQNQISFIKIDSQINQQTDKKHKPLCPRFDHVMISLGSSYIALVGGKAFKNQEIVNLRDTAVYDISQNRWTRINPINGIIPQMGNISGIFYNNSIYIIGTNPFGTPSMFQMQFKQLQLIRPQLCGNCQKRIQRTGKGQNKYNKKSPFLSNGLFYNLALNIDFPYHAFALLVDCAVALKATQFQVKMNVAKNGSNYIQIRFDGQELDHDLFGSICSHTDISHLEDKKNNRKYAAQLLSIRDKIKLGSFRLGKTFILINTSPFSNMRKVLLFSSDSLIVHNHQSEYSYMHYEESIMDNYINSKDGLFNKKYIINYLRLYLNHPEQILESQNGESILLIFQINSFHNSEKQTFNQLITTDGICDIQMLKNFNKVQFLEKIGFHGMRQDPQVSLAGFMKFLYVKRQNQGQMVDDNNKNSLQLIRIQQMNIKLHDELMKSTYCPYQNYIRQLIATKRAKILYDNFLKDIEIIQLKDDHQVEYEALICQLVDTKKYTHQNQGILIYYNNRLINRFEIEFGNLFWSKFNKLKYKQAYGIWKYIGIVYIKSGVTTNTAMTHFKQDMSLLKFYKQIDPKFIQVEKGNIERIEIN